MKGMTLSRKKSNDPRRGQRVHKGAAQTAINTYRRNGRTVTLIGISHMADEDYYRQIRKRVDEHETAGAVIHYEKASSFQRDLDRADTEAERTAMTAFRDSLVNRFKPYQLLNLGWQTQADSVMDDLGEHWHLIDTGMLNVVRLFGPLTLMQNSAVAGPGKVIPAAEMMDPGSIRYKMLRAGLRGSFINRFGKEPKRDDVVQDVFYTYREAAWTLAILDAAGIQDVVSIMGAPHLRGLDQALTRNDFDLVNSEWLTAISSS